jgi:hypothetical protein
MREHSTGAQKPENSHAPGQFDREINVRSIVAFLVVVTAATAVSALLMWFLFRGLLAREVAQDPPPLAIVERTAPAPPPGPRLQVTPEKDMAALRAEEQAALTGYAWVDRGAGRVRIPIERAMALIAARGVPPLAAPQAAAAASPAATAASPAATAAAEKP